MIVKSIITGRKIKVNTYVISCPETKHGILIDPGAGCKEVIKYIEKEDIRIKNIVITHAHPDHCDGIKEMELYSESYLLLGKKDENLYNGLIKSKLIPIPELEYKKLGDGDSIDVGNFKIRILEAPGHTAGSILLFGEDTVFIGDTDIEKMLEIKEEESRRKSIGATASRDEMVEIIYLICPGHGPSKHVQMKR